MVSRLPRPTGSAVAAGVVLLWIGVIVVGFWVFFADRSEPVDIVGIVGYSDSTELILRVEHGACKADRPDVDVDEDEVTVGLSARYDASGDCDDVIVESTVVVTLDEPLGSRRIESKAANDGRTQVCLIDDVPSTRCSQT